MSICKSKFIAFEGIDGAGKSTQITRLRQWLERQYAAAVVVTAEPTYGAYGAQIRNAKTRLAPSVERNLFRLDRMEHVENVIKPALDCGKVVITDRYFYSSVAYQGTRRDAFDDVPTPSDYLRLQSDILAENREIAPVPDILVFVSIEPQAALARIDSGRAARDSFETLQTLSAVDEVFRRIVADHPHAVVVDGTPDPEVVARSIASQVDRILRGMPAQ